MKLCVLFGEKTVPPSEVDKSVLFGRLNLIAGIENLIRYSPARAGCHDRTLVRIEPSWSLFYSCVSGRSDQPLVVGFGFSTPAFEFSLPNITDRHNEVIFFHVHEKRLRCAGERSLRVADGLSSDDHSLYLTFPNTCYEFSNHKCY